MQKEGYFSQLTLSLGRLCEPHIERNQHNWAPQKDISITKNIPMGHKGRHIRIGLL